MYPQLPNASGLLVDFGPRWVLGPLLHEARYNCPATETFQEQGHRTVWAHLRQRGPDSAPDRQIGLTYTAGPGMVLVSAPPSLPPRDPESCRCGSALDFCWSHWKLPQHSVRPQVLEEDTLVGCREGSELAHAGRGGWMHRKKHSKCFCVGVDSNSFRDNKEVRLLHSMITAYITFLFLDNLTCWQRLAHRAGTVSLPPCGSTTEHGPWCHSKHF